MSTSSPSRSPSSFDANEDDGGYINPYIDSDMRHHPNLSSVLFPDPLAQDVRYLAFILNQTDLYNNDTKRWIHSPVDGRKDSIAAFLHRIGEAIAVASEATSAYHWIQSSKFPVATLMSKDHIEPGYYRRACYVHASGDFEADLRSLIKNVRWENYNFDNRRFVIGMIFNGDDLYLVQHDRGGRIVSSPIDYHDDPRSLVRILYNLMHGSDHPRGYDPSIFYDEKTDKCMIRCDQKEYEVIENLYNSQDLYGPRCVVWRVQRDGKDYIIKDVWQDAAFAEIQMMQKLAGIEGLAQLVAYDLPTADSPSGTATTQYRDGYYDLDEEEYELVINRIQSRMVIAPVGDDMEHFKTMREFIGLFLDTIKAHGRMKKKKIVYKDVSMGNMVFGADLYDKELDRRRGVIIDFGCSMEEGNIIQNYDLIDRAGTVVFMAIDVLLHAPGPEHKSHHDLESFFYLLLWSCVTFASPADRAAGVPSKDEKTTPLILWADIDGRNEIDIGRIKEDMMMNAERFKTDILDNFQPYFRRLVPFIELLRSVIFDRTYTQGPITHEEMVYVLQQAYDTTKDIKEEDMAVTVALALPATAKRGREEEDDEQLCESPAKRSRTGDHMHARPLSRSRRGSLGSHLPSIPLSDDDCTCTSDSPAPIDSTENSLALVLYVPPPVLKRKRSRDDIDSDDKPVVPGVPPMHRKRSRSNAETDTPEVTKSDPPSESSSRSSVSRSQHSPRPHSASDADTFSPASPC